MQTVIPLQNGLQGALRLTTAKYFTPSGRSIQALGIDPDILMPVVYPGQDQSIERPSESDLPGALNAAGEEGEAGDGSESTIQPVECETGVDCQLNRALEILADATAYRQALAGPEMASAQ